MELAEAVRKPWLPMETSETDGAERHGKRSGTRQKIICYLDIKNEEALAKYTGKEVYAREGALGI